MSHVGVVVLSLNGALVKQQLAGHYSQTKLVIFTDILKN
jgi:hypothetical protein